MLAILYKKLRWRAFTFYLGFGIAICTRHIQLVNNILALLSSNTTKLQSQREFNTIRNYYLCKLLGSICLRLRSIMSKNSFNGFFLLINEVKETVDNL